MERSIAIIIFLSYHHLMWVGSGIDNLSPSLTGLQREKNHAQRNQTQVVSSAPRPKLDGEILDLKLEPDAIMQSDLLASVLCM